MWHLILVVVSSATMYSLLKLGLDAPLLAVAAFTVGVVTLLAEVMLTEAEVTREEAAERGVYQETLSERLAAYLCNWLVMSGVGRTWRVWWLFSAVYWLLLAALPVPRGNADGRPSWMPRADALLEARDDFKNFIKGAPREWD